MIDVIRELEQKRFDPGAIDAFLKSRTFPIVEGTAVTFVFRGHADQVLLRHWIYGLPASQAFQLPLRAGWLVELLMTPAVAVQGAALPVSKPGLPSRWPEHPPPPPMVKVNDVDPLPLPPLPVAVAVTL